MNEALAANVWDSAATGSYANLPLPADRSALERAFIASVRQVSTQLPPPPPMATGKTLRLLSFNVLNGFAPFPADTKAPTTDRALSLLKSLGPTVVGLQEFTLRPWNSDQGQFLAKLAANGLKMAAWCPASNLYGGPYGNAILLNHLSGLVPIAVDCVPLNPPSLSDKEGRSAAKISFDLPGRGRRLHIYSTQLDVWDHSGSMRLAEAKTLVDHIKSTTISNRDAIVVMGDLNATQPRDYSPSHFSWISANSTARDVKEDFSVLEYLRREGLIDAAEIKGERLPLSVWSGKRVDYILCKNIAPKQIVRVSAIPVVVSDHLPLLADLAF